MQMMMPFSALLHGVQNGWLSLSVVTGVLAVAAWIASMIRCRCRTGLRHLPGPWLAAYSRLWNLTNAASGRAPENFQKLHNKYGKIVRTGPYHVSIAEPAMIPVIYGINNKYLKTQFYNLFGFQYEDKNNHSMFSTQDPKEHKHLKSSVANKFSMSSLREMEQQVDYCNIIFINAMREFALSDQIVDLGTWLQWYAFDVIGAMTFNRLFGFMEQRRDKDNMIEGIESGLWMGALIGQVPELFPWTPMGNVRLQNFMSSILGSKDPNPIPKFTKIVQQAIKEYDEKAVHDDGRSDFLAWFRKAGKTAGPMSDCDLMNHLLNNLLAGSDTTAISLRAIFYHLIKTPNAYAKLLREIRDVESKRGHHSETFKFDETCNMPYLQACIKEAMRVHPGVGFPLERLVPKGGETLCGVSLPEGTIVGMNAWVIHQDKSVYGEDADAFRPERWLEAAPEQLRTMERCFLSFGSGSRTCIGKNISMMEMSKMVPLVLSKFDLEWAGARDSWKITTFWFAKQTEFHVRFKLRDESK